MAAFSIYLMWKSAELSNRLDRGRGPGRRRFLLLARRHHARLLRVDPVNWFRRTSPPSQSTELFMDPLALKMFVLVGGRVDGDDRAGPPRRHVRRDPALPALLLRFLGRHLLVDHHSDLRGAPVVTFFFFDVALRIVLPKGYLEPLFLPLYDIFLKWSRRHRPAPGGAGRGAQVPRHETDGHPRPPDGRLSDRLRAPEPAAWSCWAW